MPRLSRDPRAAAVLPPKSAAKAYARLERAVRQPVRMDSFATTRGRPERWGQPQRGAFWPKSATTCRQSDTQNRGSAECDRKRQATFQAGPTRKAQGHGRARHANLMALATGIKGSPDHGPARPGGGRGEGLRGLDFVRARTKLGVGHSRRSESGLRTRQVARHNRMHRRLRLRRAARCRNKTSSAIYRAAPPLPDSGGPAAPPLAARGSCSIAKRPSHEYWTEPPRLPRQSLPRPESRSGPGRLAACRYALPGGWVAPDPAAAPPLPGRGPAHSLAIACVDVSPSM